MSLDPGTIAIIATTLGTTITTLILQIMAWKREGRKHEWEIDQLVWDRKERIRVAEELRKHTDNKAEQLVSKIDENTNISAKAFEVANNVNEKLVAIGEARLKQGK